MNGDVTFPALLRFDPTPLQAATDAWDDLARAMDQQADTSRRLRSRIRQAWAGTESARLATARVDALFEGLDLAFMPATRIAQALAEYVEGMTTLRARARELAARVHSLGFELRPDGTIVGDVYDYGTSLTVNNLIWDRKDLLTQAVALDAETAATITRYTVQAVTTAPLEAFAVSAIPAAGTDPKAVLAWWSALTDAQRDYALTHYSERIGALDGIPIADRDLANRIVLDQELDRLTARRDELVARRAHLLDLVDQNRLGEAYPDVPNPDGAGLVELLRINEELGLVEPTLNSLRDAVAGRLDAGDRPRAYLIGLSTQDDGRAIVSIGNPDLADNVLTYVPGTGAKLANIGGDLDRADRMAVESTIVDPMASTATIVWLGYDTPGSDSLVGSLGDAISDDYALAARGDLDRFADGLRVTHDGDPSHNAVLGHSYGSTVVGYTARDLGLDADELIFVGSPGVGADTAGELGLDPDHVWASTAANDPIQYAVSGKQVLIAVPIIGGFLAGDDLIHGQNPAESDFGGQIFASDPGDDLSTFHAHSQYWDPKSQSLHNIALIATGNGQKVSR